jgi:hypothetical protein
MYVYLCITYEYLLKLTTKKVLFKKLIIAHLKFISFQIKVYGIEIN